MVSVRIVDAAQLREEVSQLMEDGAQIVAIAPHDLWQTAAGVWSVKDMTILYIPAGRVRT